MAASVSSAEFFALFVSFVVYSYRNLRRGSIRRRVIALDRTKSKSQL
jgi:hypothetical protein